eukprot:scaffold227858_cov23-Tisochrysis_lutea.AAC.1
MSALPSSEHQGGKKELCSGAVRAVLTLWPVLQPASTPATATEGAMEPANDGWKGGGERCRSLLAWSEHGTKVSLPKISKPDVPMKPAGYTLYVGHQIS